MIEFEGFLDVIKKGIDPYLDPCIQRSAAHILVNLLSFLPPVFDYMLLVSSLVTVLLHTNTKSLDVIRESARALDALFERGQAFVGCSEIVQKMPEILKKLEETRDYEVIRLRNSLEQKVVITGDTYHPLSAPDPFGFSASLKGSSEFSFTSTSSPW